jgi:hypothetical protein
VLLREVKEMTAAIKKEKGKSKKEKVRPVESILPFSFFLFTSQHLDVVLSPIS